MRMAGFWKRSLIWLGLVEDEEDEELPEVAEGPQGYGGAYESRDVPSIRKLSREEVAASRHRVPAQSPPAPQAVIRPIPAPEFKLHTVEPRGFNDAEEVGEQYRSGVPVIMNLQGLENEVAKRLVDFASGLTFGLEGRIERVGDKVFLLTPANVEVSAEERRRLEERGFFNQF